MSELTNIEADTLFAELDRLRARVAELEGENAALRTQVEGHCERIARQSDLLSKRAER
jgi:cell division protein FtsB